MSSEWIAGMMASVTAIAGVLSVINTEFQRAHCASSLWSRVSSLHDGGGDGNGEQNPFIGVHSSLKPTFETARSLEVNYQNRIDDFTKRFEICVQGARDL